MACLSHDAGAPGLTGIHDFMRDLYDQIFLNLETPGVTLDETGKLPQAEYTFTW